MSTQVSRSVRVVRDTAYLMTGQLAIGVVGLASTAWLARNLPGGELSVWPVCISLVAVVYPLSNLGLRDTFVRMIPPLVASGQSAEASRMLRTGMVLTFATSLLLSAVALIWAEGINNLLLKGEVPTDTVRLLALAVFWTTAAQHLEWFLNAVQEYKCMAVSRAVNNIVRPLAAVGLYWVAGINGAVVGLALGPIIGVLLSLWALAKHLRHGSGFIPPVQLLRHSAPYYAANVATGLMVRMDYVLVGALGGTASLATYFIASKIAEHVRHLDNYATDTMTPKLAEAAAEGREASERAFAKCSRYFFLALVPLHLGLAGIGTPLIVLYAGGQYASAGAILALLCMYLLAETFYALYRRHVVVIGSRWHLLLLDSLMAASKALFVAVLSVKFGGIGAAIGLTVSVLVVLPVSITLTRRMFTPVHSIRAAIVGIAGGLVAVAVSLATQAVVDSPLMALSTFPLAGGIYLLMLRGQLTGDDVGVVVGLMPARLRDSRAGERLRRGLHRLYEASPRPRQPATRAT